MGLIIQLYGYLVIEQKGNVSFKKLKLLKFRSRRLHVGNLVLEVLEKKIVF